MSRSLLLGRRDGQGFRIRRRRSDRMSQCWRWLMVDGETEERQEDDGLVSVQLCRGPRGRLRADESICQSHARLAEKRQRAQELSGADSREERESKVKKTIPRLQECQTSHWPRSTCTATTHNSCPVKSTCLRPQKSSVYCSLAAATTFTSTFKNAFTHTTP